MLLVLHPYNSNENQKPLKVLKLETFKGFQFSVTRFPYQHKSQHNYKLYNSEIIKDLETDEKREDRKGKRCYTALKHSQESNLRIPISPNNLKKTWK